MMTNQATNIACCIDINTGIMENSPCRTLQPSALGESLIFLLSNAAVLHRQRVKLNKVLIGN
jgi:hypothetical protein